MSMTADPGRPVKRDGLRVSVVVATYARPVPLRRAVESLCQQTRPPQEILIALWSGDAPTIAAVSELLRRPPAGCDAVAIVVVQANENTVAAKENAGMAEATGHVVCFMDDDAVARPQWIERIVRHYADPTVGAVGGRDVIWNADRVPEAECRRVGQVNWFGRLCGNHHRFTRGVREVAFLKGCDMSFRRELLSPVDPRLVGAVPYGFEIDLGLAVRARGYRVLYDPEAAVDHDPSSDMSEWLAILAYVTNHNQTYILLKHFGWARRIAFLLYTFLVGDRNTVGLLRVPCLVGREHWAVDVIAAHFSGKIHGVSSFWEGRTKPETHMVPRDVESADHGRRHFSDSSKSQLLEESRSRLSR